MKFVDRLKFSSTGTNAATITVSAAITGCRTPAQAIADGALTVGDANVPFTVDDGVGNWEDALFTVMSSTQLTRMQVLASSAGGTTAATFTGASLTVYNSVPGSFLSRVPCDRDVAFSQSIPLDQLGITWMAQQTVAARYTFTPAAGAVKGAIAAIRLKADGVNVPDVTAFKTPIGTAAYVNTTNTINVGEALYDGYDYWWAWSQEGSTASAGSSGTGDTAAPTMAGSLASSNITAGGFTLTWSAASDNVAVTGYEYSLDGGTTYTDVSTATTVTVTGRTASTTYQTRVRAYDAAGNKATPLSLAVTTSASSDTTAPTMTGSISVTSITQTGYVLSWSAGSDNVAVTGYEYSIDGGTTYLDAGNVLTKTITGRTAGTTDAVRVRDYDAAGNRGTPLSASVTLAAATVPSAPTIGTATGGDTTATVTWTASASNGGSSITGYTITASPSGATATAAASATSGTVIGLTNGTAYTFTVHATNAIGNSAESAASNSITPAAVDWPRLSGLSATTTESGTGPYTYMGGGAALSTEKGGLTTKSLAANVDGWLQFKILSAAAEVEVGFRNVQSTNVYTSQLSGFYSTTGTGAVPAAYRHIGSGDLTSYPPAAGDELRVGRVGGNWKTWLRRNGSSTWTEIDSWAGSTVQIWFDVVCAGTAQVQLTAWGGFA